MQSRAFLNYVSDKETKMENNANDQLESHAKEDEALEQAGKLIDFKNKFCFLISIYFIK